MNKVIYLNDNVSVIKGVGEKKRLLLEKMGIKTIFDLIEHFPIRYQDRTRTTIFAKAAAEKDILLSGKLINKRLRPIGSGRTIVEASFMDEGGIYKAIFFNMPFLIKNLIIGVEYVLFGSIRWWNGSKSIVNPEITVSGSPRDVRGIVPIYSHTRGISSSELARIIHNALNDLDGTCEWLDKSLKEKACVCDEHYAYKNIHFPGDKLAYNMAKYRLVYDKLLAFQYAIKNNRRILKLEQTGAEVADNDISDFIDALPFELTSGQLNAIHDIENDLVSNKLMNRLVQGDVGCGKTVVAEAAIYKIVIVGMQAAFMAPTEILARQHYEKIAKDFEKYGFKTALLVSGMKVVARNELLKELMAGDINILIGTHALIQDDVKFSNLGLVITDEQHRFGVNQRRSFVEKSSAANVLVMSATPIPRTLAATVYGDMDFSIIRDCPSNRKKTITRSLNRASRYKAYKAVEHELQKGNKAFIVAPSIEESEKSELASANELFKESKQKFSLYNVGIIHGQLDKATKDKIMDDFAQGRLDVLVSTVVIEVGIDIPEVTIIVIENAERFGLAQLHQLRGRVGRNSMQSYCYLINYSDSETSKERMNAMVKLSSGFDISEEDYRLRGAGDIMGTLQSGIASQSIYRLFDYKEIAEDARNDADYMIEHTEICDFDKIRFRIESISSSNNSNII